MQPRIKKSIVCKNVNQFSINKSLTGSYIPVAGDVAIFKILKIGKHINIQSEMGRNVTIIEGDHIMAAFGTRYATEQFEGYLPNECVQEFHILGAGGTVGIIHSMHSKFKDIGPTSIRIIGYAVDDSGEVINTKKIVQQQMLKFSGVLPSLSKIILSVGSSMDSGKTTTAAFMAHGLKAAGKNVAFIKLTGTIYTKDPDLVFDLGADMITHFGDMGFPSTYLCDEQELMDLYETLVNKVLPCNPDYIIIEIADGLFERETKMLLNNKRFMNTVDHVIFSSGDSLAAVNGVEILKKWGIRPFALSGLLTASPLLIKEVEANCNIPVFTIEQLAKGEILYLLEQMIAQNA
jgi:hypothetical protein